MYNEKNLRFGVDWLNVRIEPKDDFLGFIKDFQAKFNVSDDELEYRDGGICYYKKCCSVRTAGFSAITFNWNLDDNGAFWNFNVKGKPAGLFLSISGDGCRWINSRIPDGMRVLCDMIKQYPYHCSRIDVCADFLDKDNGIVPLIQGWALSYYSGTNKGFCCNMRRDDLVKINMEYDENVGDYTPNVTVGTAKSSKGVMQLYNKNVEIKKARLTAISEEVYSSYGVQDYWYRLEFRCKSIAHYVFDTLLAGGIYNAFYAAMDKYGRFYEANFEFAKGEFKDTDKCDICEEWQELMDYLMEFDIHFVEFVSQPYVRTSVIKTVAWAEQNASLLYRISQFALKDPERYRDILLNGQHKHRNNKRYRAWDDDFAQTYEVAAV